MNSPFCAEIDDPQAQEEVKDYAAKRDPQTRLESWVNIYVRLKNTTPVPARVRLVNGEFNSIYYPDGRVTGEWGKRRDVALEYIINEWHLQKSDPKPSAETKVEAEPKKMGPWLVMFGIFFVLVLAGLLVWAFVKNGNADTKSSQGAPAKIEVSSQDADLAQKPPAGKVESADNANPLEKPLKSPRQTPDEKKGTLEQKEASAPTKTDPSSDNGNITTDETMRTRACKKFGLVVRDDNHLQLATCGCKRQIQTGDIACSVVAINGETTTKELDIKAGNTADDNVGNSAIPIYYNNISCGGNGKTAALYPSASQNCYVVFKDKSMGAADYVTLHIHLRWDGNYEVMPPLGKIHID